MEKKEYLELVHEYSGDITKQVYSTMCKLQHPTYWSFKDLYQEVLMITWKKFKKYDGSKSSPRTFLNMCTHSACYDVMYKSWKSVAPTHFSTLEDNKNDTYQFDSAGACDNTGEIKLLVETIFTEKEKIYVNCFHNPNLDLAKKIAAQPKATRRIIRERLNINLVEEAKMRKIIKQKLNKVRKQNEIY
jgi:DNA-directed RNA polymerase specialized sigma24 family protein